MSDDRISRVEFERLALAARALANPLRLDLLNYLTKPRYLEEIASRLGMSRQAAQLHVTMLLEANLLMKQVGERSTRTVVEYRLSAAHLFGVIEDLRLLGTSQMDINPAGETIRTRGGTPRAMLYDREEAPELLIMGGFQPGRSVRIAPTGSRTITLGRDPASTVSLDWDLAVSNRHAEVRWDRQKAAVVDLHSRNGTRVNGRPVVPGIPQPLKSGDIVETGHTPILFRS